MVEIGLSIASVAYGALLRVFLFGTLTRWPQWGAITGMICGFPVNLVLWLDPLYDYARPRLQSRMSPLRGMC